MTPEPIAETWDARLADALRAERDWRETARQIVGIYRAERGADGGLGRGRFNMLYANASVLAPAIYQQAPRADVRRRFGTADPLGDRASSVLQAALNASFESGRLDAELRRLVLDLLLPGRAVMRLRWSPVMRGPAEARRKVWESVDYDYVFWEDFTCEPARRWKEVGWCAFRHYLTLAELEAAFGDRPETASLLADADWRRGALVHAPVGTAGASRAGGDDALRAMVWECWDKTGRTIDWVVPGAAATWLRRDEDVLGLAGFFPCPEPLTAISTNNTLVPVPEYEIYRDLATEIARLTERIDAIMKRMRVRGLFNGSIEELADALDGEDGRMIPVSAVEMEALSSNIWLVPLDMLAQTAGALYAAREQAKQALYEVTGISDMLRGQSAAGETATAQRIKGNFGTLRIDERRRALAAMLRELVRMAAEIMASRFSARTLSLMSGHPVDGPLESFLRDESLLMCRVDVETDSTIAADEAGEQEAAARLVQAVATILQTFGPLVQMGAAPPELLSETMRVVLRPFGGARDLVELMDAAARRMQAAPPPPPDAPGVSPELALRQAEARQDMQLAQEKHAMAMAKGQQEMAIRQARFELDNARTAQTLAGRP